MLLSNKRGVSLMIGYVLLISMTVALSIIVYPWLKGLVVGEDVLECPSGVSLMVTDFSCDSGSGNFLLTVANKGRFSVDSIVFRFSDSVDSSFGIDQVTPDSPGNLGIAPSFDKDFIFSTGSIGYQDVKVVDLQPVKIIDGREVVCKSFTVKSTNC